MRNSERVSAREARSRFAELSDRVKYTGEPVVVEKRGRPFVALIRFEDLELVEGLLAAERQAGFSRLAARAAAERRGAEPSEDEITDAVRATREEIYRRRYGGA
ncbi:MAG: type II toxin-antitoxin system Phd/YefM family antitoxin [Thermoanaerobaculia bacterium]